MSLLKNFRKNRSTTQDIAAAQFDMPEQAQFIGMPQNQKVFQACSDIAELTVIEKKYKDTSFKEIFVVDLDLVKHLKKKSYRVKRMDVVKTESDECRVILQTIGFKNSWIDSNLEAMEIGQDSPIFVVRDTDAGVYETHKAEGTAKITITEEDIESTYLKAFSDYEIKDLDHPALTGLLEIDVQRDVVDSSKFELKDELDDNVATNSSVEELEEPDELPDATEELSVDDDSDLEIDGVDWDEYMNMDIRA